MLIGAVATTAVVAGSAVAIGQIANGVPNANPRSAAPADILASGFTRTLLASGDQALENPSGIITRYGYLSDSASQNSGLDTKTEPDQNTYVVTKSNPGGPSAGFDYGRRFLLQGHELFSSGTAGVGHSNSAYLTRINLDVPKSDPRRITLLNTADQNGNTGMASIDGSTYDPFTGEMVFTGEGNNQYGGVFTTKLAWTSTSAPAVNHLLGQFGTAGYEGVQFDDKGNAYLVEDAGGSGVTDNGAATKVRQPNSFLFRFVPATPGDLTAGRLQALRVKVDGTPITFHTGAGARDDALGEQIRRLHSGERLEADWVTVHDTAVDGTTTFNANALAKSAGATPLKRPENGRFVPESDFRSFVFTETGDTDKTAGEYVSPTGEAAAERGSWGAILRLDLDRTGGDTGTLRTIVLGDGTRAAFDSITFLDTKTILAGEDRGDTLHQQLNALDSTWAFDTRLPLDRIAVESKRLYAQGRDAAAFADVQKREAQPPVADQNDGDNEITGLLVAYGSPSVGGLLGSTDPGEVAGTRIFVTNQHGENNTYELLPPPPADTRGPKGDTGAAGPKGSNGSNGASGPQGPKGDKGVAGDRGPRGFVTVTCRVVKKKFVSCTKFNPNGGSKKARARAARLMRSKRVYARGTSTRLRAVRRLTAGRYLLVLGSGKRSARYAVRVK